MLSTIYFYHSLLPAPCQTQQDSQRAACRRGQNPSQPHLIPWQQSQQRFQAYPSGRSRPAYRVPEQAAQQPRQNLIQEAALLQRIEYAGNAREQNRAGIYPIPAFDERIQKGQRNQHDCHRIDGV